MTGKRKDGNAASRVARHAMAGTPLPPDLKDRQEEYDRIRSEVGNLPPGHVPGVPWDYNDDADAIPPG